MAVVHYEHLLSSLDVTVEGFCGTHSLRDTQARTPGMEAEPSTKPIFRAFPPVARHSSPQVKGLLRMLFGEIAPGCLWCLWGRSFLRGVGQKTSSLALRNSRIPRVSILAQQKHSRPMFTAAQAA